MALCKKFKDLTIVEKRDFIGNLVHCVQNDDDLFEFGQQIIFAGKMSGVLHGVVVNPENTDEENNNNNLKKDQ